MRNATWMLLCALCVTAPSQTTILQWTMPAVPTVSTAGPGDVNGDGVPDVAFGGSGCVKVRSGYDGGLLWQQCDLFASLGVSIANAGDVDFDGINDIVAAANGTTGTAGYTRIFSGVTGAVVRTIPVATVGVDGGRDFDGDGIPDQLGFYFGGTMPGQNGVHVFSGSSGNVLLTVSNAWCGCGVPVNGAFIGDVDANGFDDLVVGFGPNFPAVTGTAAVFSGPAGAAHAVIIGVAGNLGAVTVADVGDLTGDGRPEVGTCAAPGHFRAYDVATGGIIAIPVRTFIAPTISTYNVLRPANVARLGDVDGDGTSDVVFGVDYNSPLSLPVMTLASAWVLSGSSGLPLTTAYKNFVTNLPSSPSSVAAVGDVNFDGIPDIVHAFPGGATSCLLRVVSSLTLPSAPPTTNLGGACGTLPPLLQASPLRIGTTWSVDILGALPVAIVDLVVDVATPAPVPFGSCTWHPDLAHIGTWFVIPLVMDSNGSRNFSTPMPTVPTLAGITVTTQAVVYGTASPFGFDLSNGVQAIAGF